MVKKGLGNGLDALFGDTVPLPEESLATERVQLLKIDSVKPNPDQPRRSFAEAGLRELIKSVREQGILQPLLVRPLDGGEYQIIAGERRYRAAVQCGLSEVPCIVRNLDDNTTLEVALIENIQRQDLNPLEEAAAYKELMTKYNYTQSKLAEKLGKSRVYIANTVRLLSLSEGVKKLISDGKLSAGHGRAILQLSKEADRLALADKILSERLSVRQAEYLAKNPQEIHQKRGGAAAKKTAAKPKAAAVSDLVLDKLADELRAALGTKVSVRRQGKGGRIVLEYFSDDELQRLIEILLPGQNF